jgi:hypothetical protein
MIKKVFSFLMASFLAVVLFELFLRFSPFSYGISPVVYDKDVGMWHKKNFSSIVKRECYENRFYFDDKGLIQNAYAYDTKKPDIMIVGDSYMEALMVNNKNIIHNVLYDAYAGQYNFVNYGLSGTSMVQQYIMIKDKADLAHVKSLVQFIRIESDIDDVLPSKDGAARPKVYLDFKDFDHYEVISPKAFDKKEKIRDFLGNFELYVFLKKSIYYVKERLKPTSKTAKKQEEAPKDLSYNWLQVEGAIYQTKKLLQEKGITYRVLLYGKESALNQHLKSFLKAQNIVYHDIRELAEKSGFALEGFACDAHWNNQTHLNVAKLIYEKGLLD